MAKYKIQDYYPFEARSRVKTCTDGKDRHRYTDDNGKEQTDTTATLTYSMMTSGAFKDLNPRQRMLYVYAKAQFYGARSRPSNDYRDIKEFKEYRGQRYFYLNKHLLVNVYDLYTENNRRDLYNDISALEKHGFIERYADGKANKRRSIFRYSEAWKNWKQGYEYTKVKNKWEWVKV